MLVFDETNALFGKCTQVKDSHDRYVNTEVTYLLQRLKRFNGLSILATNLKNAFDKAFLKLSGKVIDFLLPDAAFRPVIWARGPLPWDVPLGSRPI